MPIKEVEKTKVKMCKLLKINVEALYPNKKPNNILKAIGKIILIEWK